ncbi:MAG: hypothetical protein ACT6SA_04790 [Aeromicrobium sp.]|uniref:hypothetical protein n=1 Tax=Aeromicrobium sp. TaxID=1871063 RepID=UPI004034CA92
MTTPLVVTVRPTSGLAEPVPWISAIVTSTGGSGGVPLPSQSVPQACGVGAPPRRSAALSSVS